jgi:hypothetical protein
MSKSTIFMPCNYSGHYDPAVAAKFGIVDFECADCSKICICERRPCLSALANSLTSAAWITRTALVALSA